MTGFGHYDRTVAEIEKEIALCCILLGLDWTDEAQVRTLIDGCLRSTSEQHLDMLRAPDKQTRIRGKLFALLALLLDTMRQSAQAGIKATGSRLCQALNRAFIEAYDRLDDSGHSSA
ncbi:MAG: hypothetical protein FWH56_10850 [Betaproteobacteria bacterium]|nr:hypothetical protein [Betaproteobacteria bacterium]